MNLRNERVSQQERRRQLQLRKNIGYIIIIAVLCFFISILVHMLLSQPEKAHASNGGTIVYHNIVIKPNDSLWSLAKTYSIGCSGSTRDYVRTLRKINHLSSDTIHAGECLIVPVHVSSSH